MSETTAPPIVDATGPFEEPPVDVFAAAGDPTSPYQFVETEWPEKPKPAPRAPNPFQGKIDQLLTDGLPSRAIIFTAPAADEKTIRGQIQRAAGDRATAQIKIEPVEGDEGKIAVRFRLVEKIHRSKPVGAHRGAPAPEVPAAAGGAAD